MKFEERLNELINEAEVPDELLPQNIAAMLKANNSQSHAGAEKKNIKLSSNAYAQRRTIIMRTAAATAACAVFTVGMIMYNGSREESQQIEERIEYEAVSPNSYDDLYNIYTDIYLNGSSDRRQSDGYGDDTTIEEESPSDGQPIEHSGTSVTETPPDISAYDFTDYDGLNVSVSEADIVKCDDSYMYCLKDKTLYIVSLETMEVVSEIECSLDPPIEVYIEGDNVVIVSTETGERRTEKGAAPDNADISPTGSDVPASDPDTIQPASYNSDSPGKMLTNEKTGSDIQNFTSEGNGTFQKNVSRINTAVDIYNLKDPEHPMHRFSYRQNGSYTASRLVDGKLYMVTAYSDYQTKPLDEQSDLDSFVPAYYINGEKFFLAAEDITVPAGANNTDYAVVSEIDIGAGTFGSAKAVLGSGKNVYCSAETLYVVGTGKKDKEYSVISAFDLSADGIKYRTSGSVEGIVLGQKSISEYGGNFRIATMTADENNTRSVSVYVLDRSLTVINSAGQLFPGADAVSVRFEGNYARIFENGEKISSAVLDLSSCPPSLIGSPIVSSSYLYSYSDKLLLSLGRAGSGGAVLTMYDAQSGAETGSISFAEEETEIFSKAFDDRRAALVDPENGMIGVPVYSHTEFGTKNNYYVFGYDESTGFSRKGVIEYTDIDDSSVFERGQISGDRLYVISKGRIIAARSSDLKVIGVYEY